MTTTWSMEQYEKDPIELFYDWYEQAEKAEVLKADAFTLATADKNGTPNARILLFKGLIDDAFTFYTNFKGQKGYEIQENPQGHMVFYWAPLGRQVRVHGKIEKIRKIMSDLYFKQRPRGSQIATHISKQDQEIDWETSFEDLIKEVEEKFKDQEIPCPDYWGGYKLIPDTIEFWEEGENRLHMRVLYKRDSSTSEWTKVRLAP